MKYIKTYEDVPKEIKKVINPLYNSAISNFFDNYENAPVYVIESINKKIENLHIPDFLIDEFKLLYFMYEFKYYWKSGYDFTVKYIKEQVKKVALKSIINKIDDDRDKYKILKEYINKYKFRKSDENTRYIYILFMKALKNSWISDTEKYNL